MSKKVSLSYAFFWAIPPLLNFICQRFGTLCLFHLPPAYENGTDKSVPKRRHIKFRCQRITHK